MKTNDQLKLFVWRGPLTNYISCVMFALAHNVGEARKAIEEPEPGFEKVINWEKAGEPEIVEDVKGFFLWGSDWKANEEGRCAAELSAYRKYYNTIASAEESFDKVRLLAKEAFDEARPSARKAYNKAGH